MKTFFQRGTGLASKVWVAFSRGTFGATTLVSFHVKDTLLKVEILVWLTVDDDLQALRHIRDALSAAGYSPVVTGDPREVSHLVKTKKPQLVLLDLMLSGTDGIELMKRVPDMADLPVIFISGFRGDENRLKDVRSGELRELRDPTAGFEEEWLLQAGGP